MDLLTVNIVFETYPTKSFYFYQQNTLQQAKEMIIGAHQNLPQDIQNYGIFQPLQGSQLDKVQGKFLEESKTFASYRLYGTIALHFMKKSKIGCSNKKQSKIFQYVQEKKLEKLKELLEDNDPNCIDDKGTTPFQYAIIQNDRLLMQTLVENGAFLDFRGRDMQTPLHTAIIHDKYTAVHFLVMLGHILDAKDDKGFTPLYYAVTSNNIFLSRYLLTSGAREIEQPDSSGKTLLMHAIFKDSPVIVSDLLQHGADVNANSANLSCLNLSVSSGSDEISRILLQNNANRETRNKQGQTPSNIAMVIGNVNMYKLLESYDGSPLHSSAHPFGVYPYEAPIENKSASIKKDRIGALKLKAVHSVSTDSLKKRSSPNSSIYSLDNNDVLYTNIEWCKSFTCIYFCQAFNRLWKYTTGE